MTGVYVSERFSIRDAENEAQIYILSSSPASLRNEFLWTPPELKFNYCFSLEMLPMTGESGYIYNTISEDLQ